jgi:hypothetical protein
MEAGAQLMDKIRRECSCWADGNENICLTFDEAETLPELAEVLKGVAINNKELRKALKPYKGGCDVIVSK